MPVDKRERPQANFLRIFEGEGEHHRIGENIFWGKVVEGGGALEVARHEPLIDSWKFSEAQRAIPKEN